jgi:hypothetical protein
MIKMGRVNIYLHKSVHESCDFLATLLDTSRSETIEDMIRYILDNDLQEEVWGEAYTNALEALEEDEEEEEELEEEEEEED